MSMPNRIAEVRRAAAFQLNALHATDALPVERFEGARLGARGTLIYDVNGDPLFQRIPLARGREIVAFADVAANEAMGDALIAVSHGVEWNEKSILKEAAAAARKKCRGLRFDKMRFVAYSFPKVAVQFLLDGQEVLMLEWMTWAEVPLPKYRERRKGEPPGNFERWSFLDEMPPAAKRARIKRFDRLLGQWNARRFARLRPYVLDKAKFLDRFRFRLFETYEMHYSPHAGDHKVCFELRGQQTNVWCVAASVQMLLLFYRYNYTQVRLADEMDLGTLSNPNGLPYGDEQKVVDTIEKLSSNALDAAMNPSPTFNVYRNDLRLNRPMVSFIPGHSRAAAGYTRNLLAFLGFTPFRGLLVYDPWPPNAGVITRWENFDTSSYRHAFTARLKHV
jgi:hypothetical protein